MKKKTSKILAMFLTVVMLAGVIPMNIFAAGLYDENNGGSEYYNLISERSWNIAPGVQEYEQVLNNDTGTRRQVLHTAVVDVNNPYVKVIPGTKGMWPQEGNYGTQSTSTQALEAEKLGYGNVVVATNCSLSWYTEAYYKQNTHLIGEPLGYSILNGEYYCNSRISNGTLATGGVATIVVINYDKHPLTGEDRPADMPKVWIRSVKDPLTGWEEQAIPVLFDFLVKPDENGNPKNLSNENSAAHGSNVASRTFVGVRPDGTLVIAVSDGEQAPYSTGFTTFEMADYMIKMGCIIAANCDGGGSTTFCSQRPGEDLKVNCSLSDGGERPTSNTILVVSTAPADGAFAKADISTDYDYYTPGASVTFNALGTDAVGTKVNIPADAEWKIKEEGMGTISDGVFVSAGTEGTVTAQLWYKYTDPNTKVVSDRLAGEKVITIAVPTEISFEQPIVTIPFGKTAKIPVKATATFNGVSQEIGLSNDDVIFTTTNEALGTFDGLSFTAVDEASAPADITSTVTATLKMGDRPMTTVQLNLGRASQVLWDFEDGIDGWNVINSRTNDYRDYYLKLSLADKTNGQVHDGDHALRLEINGLSSAKSDSSDYAWIRLGVDGDAIELENARRVGFWLYVPEDNIQCWVQGYYMTDSNGDGTYDTLATVSMMESENVYYNIDESGWHYMSMDISAFEKVALKYSNQFNLQDSNGQTTGQTSEKGEFFLAIITHRTKNNILWQTNGTINGPFTYYLDSFTVDYSEAVDDRENPIFDKIYLDGTTALVKRDVITTKSNILNLSAAVADKTTLADAMGVEQPLYNVSGLDADTAKVYIDGVEVDSSFSNGVLSANGIEVADGYHRVKFEICDNAGNKSVVIRVVKVESGVDASTINLVPANPELDRIPFGSVYWMNLEATDIETIQKVETVIDLNSVNHWQLDHMEVACGFKSEYTINEETNTATITFTRTEDNYQTGEAVLAKLPVRIIYFDTDINVPGFTAETYWTTYNFFAQDMKMDVDMGLITHVDGTTSTFSNEEFHVDTEMYTTNQAMSMSNPEYLTTHGGTHVHTPAAEATDKEATCTEAGYEGRVFCTTCNSPVEWGTTIPATKHNFEMVDGQLVCSCGQVGKLNGLQNIDGKNYYYANGAPVSGWIMVDEDWYFFDKTTYEGWDGERYTDDAIKYIFDNGRVTEGVWVKNKNGMRYWYGPSYYKDTSPEHTSSKPFVIDGNTYLFNNVYRSDKGGYMQTGLAKFFNGEYSIYYDCGEDGVAHIYTGPYDDYFCEDGVRVKKVGIVEHEGNYYYIGSGYKLVKNTKLYFGDKLLEGTNLEADYYEFDADGKMILKNGPVGDYFYKDNAQVKKVGVVEYEGNYYYIGSGYKLAKSTKLYFGEKLLAETTLTPGYYEFDADGAMILRNGPVGDYFYRDNAQVKKVGVVEYEGNYYYIGSGYKLAKSTKLYFSARLLTETTLAPGYYEFDADGKMTIDVEDVLVKNGPVGDYFYKDNAQVKKVGVVEYEGNYYYIGAGYKLAKSTKLYFTERLLTETTLTPGYYEFDADGAMILKNGPVGDYFYNNNVQVKKVGVVEYEGNYYYIGSGYKLAKNTKLYFSERLLAETTLTPGYYEFDADGTMILRNGPVGDYFYKDNVQVRACQLIEHDGNYYYIGAGYKIAKSCRLYFSAKLVAGKYYSDGSMIEVGYHSFDETGKMTD